MSKRLDQQREQELQPKRIEFAASAIQKRGYEITFRDNTRIEFTHQGETVRLYPYSGWHTGKTIRDGRGLQHLLNQLKTLAAT